MVATRTRCIATVPGNYERGAYERELESRWEAQELLARYGVWPGGTVEAFDADFDNAMTAAKKCRS